jgi:hypothetical protein
VVIFPSWDSVHFPVDSAQSYIQLHSKLVATTKVRSALPFQVFKATLPHCVAWGTEVLAKFQLPPLMGAWHFLLCPLCPALLSTLAVPKSASKALRNRKTAKRGRQKEGRKNLSTYQPSAKSEDL